MKKLILIASLLMASGLWAEEDNLLVCEVTVKKLEKDILKCKEGDILSIKGQGAGNFYHGSVARACKLLDFVTYTPDNKVLCIYRGSLREVR